MLSTILSLFSLPHTHPHTHHTPFHFEGGGRYDRYPTMPTYDPIQQTIPSDASGFLKDVTYWFEYKRTVG